MITFARRLPFKLCSQAISTIKMTPLTFSSIASKTMMKNNKCTGFTMKLNYGFACNLHPNIAKTINLPNVADSVTEGKVLELTRNVGDWVEQDETVAQLETDKVTVDIKAPVSGTITKFYAKEGDNLEVGKPFYDIDPEVVGKKATKTEKKETVQQSSVSQASTSKPQKQSKQQSQSPKQQQRISEPVRTSQQKNYKPSFGFSQSATERKQVKEPLSSIRIKSGERLKQVQNIYALLTTFQECDVGNVLATIQKYQEPFTKKYGTNLGLLSFFIKASAGAIVENPIVNSIIDGTQLVKRNYVDINVSLATSYGIISPVLRNCNVRSIFDIQTELNEISQKAESGKLSVNELDNGTFSINNAQVDSSLMTTPIIRPLQSALLGINSVVTKPIARDGQIVARPIMFISLTYDHRILDGKDAVVTLKSIKEQIEDPSRILLGV